MSANMWYNFHAWVAIMTIGQLYFQQNCNAQTILTPAQYEGLSEAIAQSLHFTGIPEMERQDYFIPLKTGRYSCDN